MKYSPRPLQVLICTENRLYSLQPEYEVFKAETLDRAVLTSVENPNVIATSLHKICGQHNTATVQDKHVDFILQSNGDGRQIPVDVIYILSVQVGPEKSRVYKIKVKLKTSLLPFSKVGH